MPDRATQSLHQMLGLLRGHRLVTVAGDSYDATELLNAGAVNRYPTLDHSQKARENAMRPSHSVFASDAGASQGAQTCQMLGIPMKQQNC